MDRIYLDACSTTRLDPRVTDVMTGCYQAGYVNPASQHRMGQHHGVRLEQAVQQIREALEVGSRSRLILTSGGTESNNLVLFGGGRSQLESFLANGPVSNIVVSRIEHSSVLAAAEFLGSHGEHIRYLPTRTDGLVEIDALADAIDEQTRLVSLMLVNNETGAVQPVEQAARICAERNVPLHCDAVQALGKIPVSVQGLFQCGVSAITLTAHKLHGPRGIGALVTDEHLELAPMMFGGFQQLGLRPGTQDVALAAGFAESIVLAVSGLKEDARAIHAMRELLERKILREIPDAQVNGHGRFRAPHCSSVAFPGNDGVDPVDRQALMMACDRAGVALATGSACASGSSEPSHVLQAMGLDRRVVDSTIRVSFSRLNTLQESGDATDRIIKAVKHLRQANTGRK